MADLIKLGTVVPDAIVPGNPTAPAQYSEYTQGGLHTGKADIAAIYAISVERRQWGMEAKTELGATYELIKGLVSENIADNGNWRLKPAGTGTGGPKVVQTTGTSAADVMSQDAVTKELAGKVPATDPRLTDARTPTTHTHPASQISDFATAVDGRINLQKGQPNGTASLDGTGKVFTSQLPAYVSDVQEHANLAAFPSPGIKNIIYVAIDTNLSYRWGGTQYTKIGDGQGVESFMGRTGNIVLTQADIDAFLVDLKADVAELQTDLSQVETDVTRIDNEVDVIQQVVPANASPTNKLVTQEDIIDLTTGSGATMSFTATRSLNGISAGQTVVVNDDASGRTLKLILAPADGPNASLSANNSVRQPGSTTAVVLSYSTQAATYAIKTIVVNGQTVTAGSGTVNAATQPNTDTTFSMTVTDVQNMQTTRSTSVIYRPLRFWGALGTDPLSLSDADLSTLIRTLSSEFSTDRQQSRSITANNEYLVFAGRASAWGGAQYEVNGLSNNAFTGKTFNFTNSVGFTESFYVARGGQRLVGTFSATVK